MAAYNEMGRGSGRYQSAMGQLRENEHIDA